MNYISVAKAAEKWNVSVRTARNYCASGKIQGAFLTGKTWNIPARAERPHRINRHIEDSKTLLEHLRAEKSGGISGGIYHKIQIEWTYHSNHIEGSRLTREQIRYIYETNTIGTGDGIANVDDIVEAVNHFKCIDLVLEYANYALSESFIKLLHQTLKSSTSDSRKDWFAVGEYKKLPNEVNGIQMTAPEEVPAKLRALLEEYNKEKQKTLQDILAFHVSFEGIHPFQDGNGRIGRLILLKECLRNRIVPFVIDESLKISYYRGLCEWPQNQRCLQNVCFTAQTQFRTWLDYFHIPYEP